MYLKYGNCTNSRPKSNLAMQVFPTHDCMRGHSCLIELSSNEVLGKPLHMHRLVRAVYARIYKDCGFHYAEG